MKSRFLHEDQAAAIEAARKGGWRIVRSKVAPTVTFAFKLWPDGKVWLQAWRGSAVRNAANYSFRNMARAEAYAAEFAANEAKAMARKKADQEDKAEKRKNLRAADFWQVGDVVYTSWGYDQTNVEYYQILEVKARSVKIQQIAMNSSDQPGGPMGGYAQPRRYEFVGNPYLSPIDEHGGFTAGPTWKEKTPSFRHRAYKWDGKARYTSSYH